MSLRLLPAAALLLLLSACGDEQAADDPGPTPASSPAASGTAAEGPACDEVWVEGATLPEDYSGCVDDTGQVPADAQQCATGARLVTFADRYYAMTGHRVNVVESLATSDAYKSAEVACGG